MLNVDSFLSELNDNNYWFLRRRKKVSGMANAVYSYK